MITKSITLIMLVTFANLQFASPRPRGLLRRKLHQMPYRHVSGCPAIYAEKTICPCESKQNIIPDTTCNMEAHLNRNEQLILPPRGIELPFGLGYSFAALPAVAEAYNEKMFDVTGVRVSEAFIPVSPEFANIKIATPFSCEWGSLVKSIVL